jgi:hypothetical protein
LTPLEVIAAKRAHLDRLANQRGAVGEQEAVLASEQWVPRPKGLALRGLMDALAAAGIHIKASSFDALAVPPDLDITDTEAVRARLLDITFIEIKTANQPRVKAGFDGFFFALTENEIAAADALGERHRVALYNKISGEILIKSVPEIVARAKSSTWQFSVQL